VRADFRAGSDHHFRHNPVNSRPLRQIPVPVLVSGVVPSYGYSKLIPESDTPISYSSDCSQSSD